MCTNKNSTNPMIQKRKPSARRARRAKFISLKTELPPSPASSGDRRTHQLDLFPLHPEEKDENVDHLLDSGGGATLTGVLDAAEGGSPPPSAAYAYRGQESEIGGGDAIVRRAMLVRTAMRRRKEGHAAEEKWVRYSEVVEKKEEEVASCSDGPSRRCSGESAARSLSLKLDYQEVLDAWSGKGSLYIGARDGDPQTVPDLRDDDFFGSGVDCSDNNNNGVVDGSGSVGNVWTVPENVGKDGRSKAGQREASVLRYKEKRQNRLFSKQIRYQVRKLNAEKRPRMKGRFVKRN